MRTLAFLVVVAAILAATAAVMWRPAVLFGVSKESLAYSLARDTGADVTLESGRRCRPLGDDRWRCQVPSASSSPAGGDSGTPVVYDVREEERGCWTARRDGGRAAGDLPERAEACITVRDLVRLADRL